MYSYILKLSVRYSYVGLLSSPMTLSLVLQILSSLLLSKYFLFQGWDLFTGWISSFCELLETRIFNISEYRIVWVFFFTSILLFLLYDFSGFVKI